LFVNTLPGSPTTPAERSSRSDQLERATLALELELEDLRDLGIDLATGRLK